MENKKEKNNDPVIIRRAVIISDDKKEEEEKNKKSQTRKDTSFNAAKDRKKDYNIVYRDKPSKPLTVSELFGFPKKETKKKEEEVKPVKVEQKETVKEDKKVEKTVVVEEKEVASCYSCRWCIR